MVDLTALVETHFKIKAKLAAMEADYKLAIAKYEEARDKVKGQIVDALDEMGVENVKTTAGTPYFTHPESYKVSDMETFVSWVVERSAYEILPATLARKDAVRAACEEGVPPGVEVTTIRQLNIRKA